MIKEAIILAGGLGTRLRTVVNNQPKSLASINQHPFLAYLIRYLQHQQIERFVFSLGYKHELIEAFLKSDFPDLNSTISVEDEPLGTGGAILRSIQETQTHKILVCNGDTLFKINTQELEEFHDYSHSVCTVALKPMIDFSRYGAVELHSDASIRVFREKEFRENGLINGGVYLISKRDFPVGYLPEKFSFEEDFLPQAAAEKIGVYGCIQDHYFIDIGIPEDYEKAQTDEELINILG